MPKKVVSPLIYEGHFDYVIRFALNKKKAMEHPECVGLCFQNSGRYIYFHKDYMKREFTLADVEKERQKELAKYEKLGLRTKRQKWNSTKQ